MKYLVLGLLLFAVGSVAQASTLAIASHHEVLTRGDSITLDYLVGMDKKKFKGKAIQDFLASEEARGFTDVTFRYTPEGVLQGLKVKYSDNLYLNLYVTDFKYVKPKSTAKKWDLEALKKEAINEIRVLYVMYD